MKKWITLILALTCVFALAGCRKGAAYETNSGARSENAQLGQESEPIPDAPEATWGVTLTAENVTSTGLTLVISHSGDAPDGELDTGSPYWVEKWQDDAWVSLEDGAERVWTMEAWLIPVNDSREHEVKWENLYGELPVGQYRIGKEIMLFRGTGDYDEQNYYAEFVIE